MVKGMAWSPKDLVTGLDHPLTCGVAFDKSLAEDAATKEVKLGPQTVSD